MEERTYRPHCIVIGLLSLWIAVFSLVDITPKVEQTDIPASMPDQLAGAKAEAIVFCQSMSCLRSMLANDLKDKDICSHCGSETGATSPAEINMLPSDTTILRSLYRLSSGSPVTVSVVISGKERTSIHRPQMCLVGQGYSIERQHTSSYNDLRVTVLDLKSPGSIEAGLAYVYWFTSNEYETPYHVERMFLTAIDNLFKGTAPRWGYISLMCNKHTVQTEEFSKLVDELRFSF